MEWFQTLMLGVAVVGIVIAFLKWLETSWRDNWRSKPENPPPVDEGDRPDFSGNWSD